MHRLVNVKEISQTMANMAREMEKAGLVEEIIGDTMESMEVRTSVTVQYVLCPLQITYNPFHIAHTTYDSPRDWMQTRTQRWIASSQRSQAGCCPVLRLHRKRLWNLPPSPPPSNK
jgi:hypothetical protein